jgi:hypothetical protein
MGSKDTQFKKGNGGGPGRPKGAKNKLAKAYLNDLHEIYLDGGKDALEQVMKEKPDGFLSLVARLLPKDLDLKHSGDVSIRVVDYADEQDDDEET